MFNIQYQTVTLNSLFNVGSPEKIWQISIVKTDIVQRLFDYINCGNECNVVYFVYDSSRVTDCFSLPVSFLTSPLSWTSRIGQTSCSRWTELRSVVSDRSSHRPLDLWSNVSWPSVAAFSLTFFKTAKPFLPKIPLQKSSFVLRNFS